MSTAKLLILAALALMLGSFFVPSSHGFFTLARGMLWLTLGIHALECAVMLPRLRAAPGSTAGHVAKVMLFGGFHVRETPKLA